MYNVYWDSVPSSAPLHKRLNVREWDCRAVHEKAALWVLGAIHSEGHQGTTYHPALRHAHDVPEISQSPLSDRTHQVEHWGCGCVPIVLASDDMQASAVESVDTAHHCSSQRPCLGRMRQCGTHCQLTLPVKQHRPMRKRYVSDRTRQLYDQRRIHFEKLTDDERRAATRAIGVSCREDYRDYVDGVLNDIEIAERGGNSREVSRLTRLISGKRESRLVNPSKDLNGNLLVTQGRLLEEWSTFLGAKFASPDADKNRSLECLTAEYDELSDDELRMCLDALRIGKAPGCDDVPIEAYRGSEEATKELFRICRLMWNTERIPANLVRGMFVMIHKKGSRNDYGNYRAICLLCHSYKLMSAVVARRLMGDAGRPSSRYASWVQTSPGLPR